MKYSIILTDIDNTLFDFDADSRQALEETFSHFGFPFNEQEKELYFSINHSLWQDFELGKIEKDKIYPTRFRRYLDMRGLSGDEEAINRYYMTHLALGQNYLPDAEKLLKTLIAMGGRIFAVTNGSNDVQEPRLQRSGMLPYFEKVYISEHMGCQKPGKEFFDLVFAEIGEENRKNAIILGDSLTSDMQGGRNAGIATCFFGKPEKADDRCDYVITKLMDFIHVIS